MNFKPQKCWNTNTYKIEYFLFYNGIEWEYKKKHDLKLKQTAEEKKKKKSVLK